MADGITKTFLEKYKMISWQASDSSGKSTSWFEFWPTWVMYSPVAVQWLLLALCYRSLTLPLLANPRLPLAGMVGGSKHELMEQAQGQCRDAILPWVCFTVNSESVETQAARCLLQVVAEKITLPFVCKPDVGCRGAGVKLIETQQQLHHVIASYPVGSAFLCQTLSTWEPEAGIFYVRNPETDENEIVSMTFKYSPHVVGDGSSTVQQLVAQNERAGQLQHLYQSRHHQRWQQVLKQGEKLRLVFSASHCRGAVFRDARSLITPTLTQTIHRMMSDLPEFYYGRLDVKFSDIDALKNGRNIEIVEINGASSESIHIWDKDARFSEAISTLLWQYRTLFKMGAYHRRQGMKPPGLRKLITHWLHERRLTRSYPETD
ncbi:MAG: D-alanine--D-alanine ligase [Gammaproteobacteria bacterium]|nr:D-alanine--D-alanine ligase [Gammaproteobacteria bacterium]